MRKKLVIALFFVFAVAVPRASALKLIADTIGVRVYFHQSKVNLLPDYKRNSERLDSFINELHKVQTNPQYRFRSINIKGGASPEGTKRFNNWLSKQRADRITEYIEDNSIVPFNEYQVTYEYPGVDWEGLKRFVLNDPDVPNRDQVLYIIDHPGPGDDRVKRLKALKWSIPWQYLYQKYYPPLRASQVQIIFDRIFKLDSLRKAMFRPLELHDSIDTLRFKFKFNRLLPQLPFYAAFKTNLLYDLALVPSLGVDVYMGNNWSVAVNWEYAWWKCDHKHWYWRAYGGDVEFRKWMGKKAHEKPLTGHHLGTYFQLLTYDFELGHRGYQGRRWTKGGGIAYGYSKPISARFNIDFTLGVGCHFGNYYRYVPIDDHYVWKKTRKRLAITPTKIELSLVWLIGSLNYNEDKEKKAERERERRTLANEPIR